VVCKEGGYGTAPTVQQEGKTTMLLNLLMLKTIEQKRVDERDLAAYLLLQLKKCEITTAIISFPDFYRLSFFLTRRQTCNLHGGGSGRRGEG
jgi:hypothetical protein